MATSSAGMQPLIRTLSAPITSALLRTSASPNQVTAASLLAGIAAAVLFADGSRAAALAGAVLLVGCYVLDNCDGDIARRRGLASPAGALLDTVADSLVHVALFAAMGIGLAAARGDAAWLVAGGVAAAGAAINSALAITRDWRASTPPRAGAAAGGPVARGPASAAAALRSLARDDFCFVLLAAVLLDVHGWLLVASACGAQAYWLASLREQRARQRA